MEKKPEKWYEKPEVLMGCFGITFTMVSAIAASVFDASRNISKIEQKVAIIDTRLEENLKNLAATINEMKAEQRFQRDKINIVFRSCCSEIMAYNKDKLSLQNSSLN